MSNQYDQLITESDFDNSLGSANFCGICGQDAVQRCAFVLGDAKGCRKHFCKTHRGFVYHEKIHTD